MDTNSEANTSRFSESNDKDSIIAELTRSNRVLKANISTLYRTARAEISKLEQEASNLRNELDNLIFKRLEGHEHEQDQNKAPQDSITA